MINIEEELGKISTGIDQSITDTRALQARLQKEMEELPEEDDRNDDQQDRAEELSIAVDNCETIIEDLNSAQANI